MNAANGLTLLRMAMALPVAVLLYRQGAAAGWTALGLFIGAMMTDVFDGWLARRQPHRSPLGCYLDPVADKVLLMTLFICLAEQRIVPVWMATVLVARELVVDGIRAAGAMQGVLIGANWMGKTKTLVQTFAISAALLWKAGGWGVFRGIAYWLTLVATVLGVVFALVFAFWNRGVFGFGDARSGGTSGRAGHLAGQE